MTCVNLTFCKTPACIPGKNKQEQTMFDDLRRGITEGNTVHWHPMSRDKKRQNNNKNSTECALTFVLRIWQHDTRFSSQVKQCDVGQTTIIISKSRETPQFLFASTLHFFSQSTVSFGLRLWFLHEWIVIQVLAQIGSLERMLSKGFSCWGAWEAKIIIKIFL